ncbi:MAG: hypothetical protein JO072_10190 [Parafilimonas sp.]|nr:hypothetical protein [Parafilimonas sp.]
MKLQALLFPFLFLPFINDCNNADAIKAQDETPQSSSQINTITDTTKTHFGVMVAKTQGTLVPPSQQAKIAKALGVNYIRARIDLDSWGGSNDAYEIYKSAGLKVLLNVNSGIPRSAAGEPSPIPFPTDMDAYSKKLNSILDKYKPEVVVIENEEDNPNYHSGDAEDYINELKTGIQVAHSKGLKVTNGGITYHEVCAIIYDDMMQHGKQQEAKEFANKVFPPAMLMRLSNPSNQQIKRQLEFGRRIIAAYKTLDLDYVNFHWYEPVKARGANGVGKTDTVVDTKIFEFAANYIKTMTGKPIMSNEFGVFNTSPSLTRGLLQAVYNANLQYAIFYSSDGGEGRAVALQNVGGDLRENGNAFREFVKQHEAK